MQFLSLSSDMIVDTSLKIIIILRNFSILNREPPIPILSPPLSPPPTQKKKNPLSSTVKTCFFK